MHHLVATFDDAAATVISSCSSTEKEEPTRTGCVPQALMMAAGFSPAQRANTESRTMLALSYPPRFAAPVRPGVGAATGRMQPGRPVNTPTPQHCGAARRSPCLWSTPYTNRTTHVPIRCRVALAFGEAANPTRPHYTAQRTRRMDG